MIDYRARQQEIWAAEADILSRPIETPIPTDALIKDMYSKFSDYSIRAAIWALVDRGDIVLRDGHGEVLIAKPASRQVK
jgi:hypothetical protein